MTATTVPTITTTAVSTKTRGLWRTGLQAGLGAALATTVVAAVAHAAGVSFETKPGEGIPAVGFAQLTLLFSVVGVLIARSIGRRASAPVRTFTKVTVALTALSFVPDLAMPFDAASKVTLMLTHVIAAAIVIPALRSKLADRRSC